MSSTACAIEAEQHTQNFCYNFYPDPANASNCMQAGVDAGVFLQKGIQPNCQLGSEQQQNGCNIYTGYYNTCTNPTPHVHNYMKR